MILQIENPTCNAFRVLTDQRPFAGGDLDLVEIVPGFVAIVETDIDGIGFTARNSVDQCADSFCVGYVSSGGNVFTRGWGRGRIHRVDIVVFVAAFILREQDELSVAAPEVLPDRAGLVCGYRL